MLSSFSKKKQKKLIKAIRYFFSLKYLITFLLDKIKFHRSEKNRYDSESQIRIFGGNEELPPKRKKKVASNRTVTSPACPGVILRPWLDQSIQGTWQLLTQFMMNCSSAVQCVLLDGGYVVRVLLLFLSRDN